MENGENEASLQLICYLLGLTQQLYDIVQNTV